jgi:hypothetical protein
MTESNDTTIKIAFIIDNEVVQILNADELFASMLLSNPTILDVTDVWNVEPILIGTAYDPATGRLAVRPTLNGERGLTIDEINALGSSSPE